MDEWYKFRSRANRRSKAMCPLIYDPVPKYETQHRTFSQKQTHTATEANTSTHSRQPLKINSLPPAATARSFSHAFHHACLPPDDTCIAEHHFRNKFMFVITTTTTTTFTAPKEHRHLGTGARGYIEPKIDAHPQPPVEWRCRKIAISSGSTSGRNRGTATRSWPTVLAQGFEVFRKNSQRPSFTSVRRLVSTPGTLERKRSLPASSEDERRNCFVWVVVPYIGTASVQLLHEFASGFRIRATRTSVSVSCVGTINLSDYTAPGKKWSGPEKKRWRTIARLVPLGNASPKNADTTNERTIVAGASFAASRYRTVINFLASSCCQNRTPGHPGCILERRSIRTETDNGTILPVSP